MYALGTRFPSAVIMLILWARFISFAGMPLSISKLRGIVVIPAPVSILNFNPSIGLSLCRKIIFATTFQNKPSSILLTLNIKTPNRAIYIFAIGY